MVEAISLEHLQPGNSSSTHQAGRRARSRLESARQRVAVVLGCSPKEICFTASGSEANALALKGAFDARPDLTKNRIVASAIEHPATLFALEQLKGQGAEVVLVAPRPNGAVHLADIVPLLTQSTGLCSLMWANNETGVVQPVDGLAEECRQRKIIFHCDAVQLIGKSRSSIAAVDADLLTFSAHKFGGPSGAGVLRIRRAVELRSLVPGHQESGRRGGSPNLLAIEAAALALEVSVSNSVENCEHLEGLRDQFERNVLQRVSGASVQGASSDRLVNTSNITFSGVDGEALLIALDLQGICASSGAACASGSLKPSHVLLAMGLSSRDAKSSLRFSIGNSTSSQEVEQVVEAIAQFNPA